MGDERTKSIYTFDPCGVFFALPVEPSLAAKNMTRGKTLAPSEAHKSRSGISAGYEACLLCDEADRCVLCVVSDILFLF